MDKPAAPDLSPIVKRYEAPDGQLTDSSLAELRDALGPVVGQLQETDLANLVTEAVTALASARGASTSGGSSQNAAIEGTGWLRATRICPGSEGKSQPDPADGSLQLTVGFTDAGVDPVAWGQANQCRYGSAKKPLELGPLHHDTRINLWLGAATRWAELGQRPILVVVDGALTSQGKLESLELDFQFDPVTLVWSVAVGTRQGWMVVELEAFELVRIRAKNGRFYCSTAERRCSSAQESFTW